ncbi:MAG: hypothetical protein HZB99_00950 [Candidatus Harrisonbacteria bacterium]|nr:hypothetical protein [Candidatus Harrisonbacteria bacterium]
MNTTLKNLYTLREYLVSWLVPNLWWIKIISVIFSAIFLWGIIYIVAKTNYLEIKKEQFLDIWGSKSVSRRRTLRAWKQILKRLQSKESNQWKLAILEADYILNEILKMSGYLGNKLEEKLELITPAQLASVDQVRNAHEVRDKISKDPTYELSAEEAAAVIEIYKQAFKELNLIQE